MRWMKYLVTEYGSVYLFPQDEEHKAMAEHLGIKPIRGGFCYMVNGKIKCRGEAFSLGLYSDPEKDAELIGVHFCMD